MQNRHFSHLVDSHSAHYRSDWCKTPSLPQQNIWTTKSKHNYKQQQDKRLNNYTRIQLMYT